MHGCKFQRFVELERKKGFKLSFLFEVFLEKWFQGQNRLFLFPLCEYKQPLQDYWSQMLQKHEGYARSKSQPSVAEVL